MRDSPAAAAAAEVRPAHFHGVGRRSRGEDEVDFPRSVFMGSRCADDANTYRSSQFDGVDAGGSRGESADQWRLHWK